MITGLKKYIWGHFFCNGTLNRFARLMFCGSLMLQNINWGKIRNLDEKAVIGI